MSDEPRNKVFLVGGTVPDCEGCANAIVEAVKEIDGVEDASLEMLTQASPTHFARLTAKMGEGASVDQILKTVTDRCSLTIKNIPEPDAKVTVTDLEKGTTAAALEWMLADEKVMLEFYANWSGPCRMMQPVVAELVDMSGFKVIKINADEHVEIAGKYGIRSIPTMVMLDNGEKKDYLVGAVPNAELRDKITKVFAL